MPTDSKNHSFRVLITGALGSIGDAAARILARSGMDVDGFDSRSPDPYVKTQFSHFSVGDIRDLASLEQAVGRADAVVHLAARVHSVPRSEPEVAETFSVNQHATEKLCGICEKGGKRLVFVSTIAVHGEQVNGAITESTKLKPETPYAASKLSAEKAVLGVGGTVLRLPMVYGALDRGNAARMIRAIMAGWFIVPGAGKAKRSFVSRWNAGEAIRLVLGNEQSSGKTYLANDDEQTSVGEFADLIADTGKWRKPIRVPSPLLGIAAMAGTGIQRVTGWTPPLVWNGYRKLTRDLVVDGSTIRKKLGYQPMCSLVEGLREEVEWVATGRIQCCL